MLNRLQKVDIPIINMIEGTLPRIASVYKRGDSSNSSTEGTVRMGCNKQACRLAGLVPMCPEDNIRALVVKLIYEGIKEGNLLIWTTLN